MKKTGWNDERRARQADAIRSWRPWEKSSGPMTADGKEASAKNAYKGGLRPTVRNIATLARVLKRMPRKGAGAEFPIW